MFFMDVVFKKAFPHCVMIYSSTAVIPLPVCGSISMKTMRIVITDATMHLELVNRRMAEREKSLGGSITPLVGGLMDSLEAARNCGYASFVIGRSMC